VRVALISSYPLLPPVHGGRARTGGLASGLARAGAEVDVLCPWVPGQPWAGRVAGGVTCRSHLLASNLLPSVLPRSLASPLALLSLQPRSPWGPKRLLRSLADFDVFQFEFCAHADWIDLVPAHAAVVYSAHNVEFDFFAAAASEYRLRTWSARRIERLERQLVSRSDLVLTCSSTDARRLGELYGEAQATRVVPNGCDPALLQFDRAAIRNEARASLGIRADERLLLFLGGDASHNRDAVRFLVDDLMPRLDASTRLLVVGRCGDEVARSHDGRVLSVGFVDDLRPPFAAADVALNAVAFGSGSNVKLAEYLAAGLPVVSTPIGARGMAELPAGVHLADRETFSDALATPMDARPADPALLAGLTWDALGAGLLHEYETLFGSERPDRSSDHFQWRAGRSDVSARPSHTPE
jgi:glycosyltransferase involved in cell wall biosynthesis